MTRLLVPLILLGGGAFYAHTQGLIDLKSFVPKPLWSSQDTVGGRTTVQPSTPPVAPDPVAYAPQGGADQPPWALSPSTLEQRLIWEHWDDVSGWSQANPNRTAAVLWQESKGNPRAISPAGARGLMQVMPTTAHDIYDRLGKRKYEITLENLLRPEVSIYLGTAYLDWLDSVNPFSEQPLRDEWLYRSYNGGLGHSLHRMNGGTVNAAKDRENNNYWRAVIARHNELTGA